MEPKSMTFSAGAAVLIYYFAADGVGLSDITDLESFFVNGGVAGLIVGALAAVIKPFAEVGKAGLDRLTAKIKGETDAP